MGERIGVLQPFADRWMVVEEQLDDGRWLDISEVLVRQPRHRTFKFLDLLCGLQGVLVSLVLYRPAIAVADWHDDQAKGSNQGQQQGYGGCIGQSQVRMLGFNCPVQHHIHQVQSSERQNRLADDQLPDVAMHVMSQFVRQHDLDLVRCIATQHGIAQHDAACVAQAHQRGVGCRRLAAHLHGEDTAHAGMGAFGKSQQPFRQVALRQGAEFVEEREYEHRREICHDNGEEEQDQRYPQPPRLRLPGQQPVHQLDNKALQDKAQHQAFEEVAQPSLQRHGRKSKAVRQYEAAVVREWRGDQLVAQDQDQEVDQYLPGEPTLDRLPGQRVQYIAQPGSDGRENEDDDAGGSYSQADKREPAAYTRILACFLLSFYVKLCRLWLFCIGLHTCILFVFDSCFACIIAPKFLSLLERPLVFVPLLR